MNNALKSKLSNHTQADASSVLGRLVVSMLVSITGDAERFTDFLSFWFTSSG
jgi:hypothetical protein